MPTINFHEGCNYEACFIFKKKCSTKVGGINVWLNLYCWSVNLVSLNGSDFITGSEITIEEKDKKYIFLRRLFLFLFKQERKKSAVPFIMDLPICDPSFHVRPYNFDQLPFY